MIVLLISLCGIAYSIGYYMRLSALSKMKAADTQIYKQILADHADSWIEKGWTGPSHMAIHCRLHKHLVRNGANYFSKYGWISYRILVWATIISFLVIVPMVLIKLSAA